MARKTSKARPPVEDDRRAIIGLWIQPRQAAALSRVLCFSEDYLRTCDFGELVDDVQVSGDCYLEEQDGERVMLGQEGVVLFKYRLVGDTLDLSPPPTPRPDHWRNWTGWNLEGRWFRLKYDQEAEPAAAADGSREPGP